VNDRDWQPPKAPCLSPSKAPSLWKNKRFLALAGLMAACLVVVPLFALIDHARHTEVISQHRLATHLAPGDTLSVTIRPHTSAAFLLFGFHDFRDSVKLRITLSEPPQTIVVSPTAGTPAEPRDLLLTPCNWLDAENLAGYIVRDLTGLIDNENGCTLHVTLPSGLPPRCELWLSTVSRQ
jgi:hypothetical protein